MNAQRRNVLRPTERWLGQRRAAHLGVGAGGESGGELTPDVDTRFSRLCPAFVSGVAATVAFGNIMGTSCFDTRY